MPLSRQSTQGHLRLAQNISVGWPRLVPFLPPVDSRGRRYFLGCLVAGRTGVASPLLLIHWNSTESSLQSVRARVFGIARGLFLGRHVLMMWASSCLYG